MSRLFVWLLCCAAGPLAAQSAPKSGHAFDGALYSGVGWNLPLLRQQHKTFSDPMLAAHQQYFLWQNGWSIHLGKRLYQESRVVYGQTRGWLDDMGARILNQRSNRYLRLYARQKEMRTLSISTGISYALPLRAPLVHVYGMIGFITQPALSMYAEVKTAGSNDLETWALIQKRNSFMDFRFTALAGIRCMQRLRGPLWCYAQVEANGVQRKATVVVHRSIEQTGQKSAYNTVYERGVVRFQPALGLCYVW